LFRLCTVRSPKSPLLRLHEYEYYSNQWGLSLTKYYSGKPIEKNEMGGVCSTYGGEKSCIEGFGGEPEGKIPLEDPGVDGRIILRWIFGK
jgi:hypothetical protein